jgi:lysozyme
MIDAILPRDRPQLPRAQVADMLSARGVVDLVAIAAVRGYYMSTMGNPGKNDRGIYDDAIFIVAPNAFVAFNANTDPGAFRRGIAVLEPGLYRYKVGIHGLSKPPEKRYTALVQSAPVIVRRDGGHREEGWFGINIHRGSAASVSSEGCQTLPPRQWESFIALVRDLLGRYRQATVPYLLTLDPRLT